MGSILEITEPAVDYFVAATNTHNDVALFAAFDFDGAVVVDNEKTYATYADIRGWITEQLIGQNLVITPESFTESPDGGRLVASVNGDFPGAPQTFVYDFTVEGAAITALFISAR